MQPTVKDFLIRLGTNINSILKYFTKIFLWMCPLTNFVSLCYCHPFHIRNSYFQDICILPPKSILGQVSLRHFRTIVSRKNYSRNHDHFAMTECQCSLSTRIYDQTKNKYKQYIKLIYNKLLMDMKINELCVSVLLSSFPHTQQLFSGYLNLAPKVHSWPGFAAPFSHHRVL